MTLDHPRPDREIRAVFDAESITVYQAYRPGIAEPAACDGHFGPGFSLDRMTWIKPSFLWMMYRSGWATKPGQERVLAIRLRREGFEWALAHAALSHFSKEIHGTKEAWNAEVNRRPVRVQWDPERDIDLNPLPRRSIQVGLEGEASRRYVREWILEIRDVTAEAHRIHALVDGGRQAEALMHLPLETTWMPAHPDARTFLTSGRGG